MGCMGGGLVLPGMGGHAATHHDGINKTTDRWYQNEQQLVAGQGGEPPHPHTAQPTSHNHTQPHLVRKALAQAEVGQQQEHQRALGVLLKRLGKEVRAFTHALQQSRQVAGGLRAAA